MKPTYIPKNPLKQARRSVVFTAPMSFWEQLEELGQTLHPQLTGRQVIQHFVIPGFADWMDNWLAVHKPKDGSRVPIENVRMFPLILRERKVERRP